MQNAKMPERQNNSSMLTKYSELVPFLEIQNARKIKPKTWFCVETVSVMPTDRYAKLLRANGASQLHWHNHKRAHLPEHRHRSYVRTVH